MRQSKGWKRRGWVAALAVFTVAAGPAGGGVAHAAAPVPTVFIGDSYTANYGIAPEADTKLPGAFCFRSKQNYPAVATRQLARRGIRLQVQADRSCGAATVANFWTDQRVLPAVPEFKVPPQQDAVKPNTRLVVGGMGGNPLGFARILKQCSQRLRGQEGALLPAEPVDADSPAPDCRQFFESPNGEKWLNRQMEEVGLALKEMFERIAHLSDGHATTVLVGYPRLVPHNTSLCDTPLPGTNQLPFADIAPNALGFLDQVQARLNTAMADAAKNAGAHFVDLYAITGNNTACNGDTRGIAGLLEPSQLKLGETTLPWYAHPNTRGRDIQARHVTDEIAAILNS